MGNNSYSNEKKILEEELFRVEDEQLLNTEIHRSIGALTFMTKNKKMGAGSGTLISSNLVLTAAHNLYDKEQNYQYDGFRFYSGSISGVAEEYYQVEEVRYPTQFKTCPNSERLQFDYALIKLKSNVDHAVFPQITYPCSICLLDQNKDTQLEIFGYPCIGSNFKSLDKKGEKIKLHQFGLSRKDRIVSIEPKNFKICYAISTEAGQSGCPIIHSQNIIALHNGGGTKEEQFNVGRIVTQDLVNNLNKWRGELKGDPFFINDFDLCRHLDPDVKFYRELGEYFLNLGIQQTSKGNSYSALIALRSCLQNKQTAFGQGSIETAEPLRHLGEAHCKLQEYEEALYTCYESLSIYEKAKKMESPEVINIMYIIGKAFFHQKKYNESLEHYKECIRISDIHRMKISNQAYAKYYSNLGGCYYLLGRFQQAADCFETAFLSYKKANNQQYINISVKLLARGLVASQQMSKAQKIAKKYKMDLKKVEMEINQEFDKNT